MTDLFKKILIIRLSSIGDILLTSPLLRLLSQSFPQAKIDFVVKTQFYDLVRTNPHVNFIYRLETSRGRAALREMRQTMREQRYDLVVDVHNNFRSCYLRKIPGARIVKIKKYKWPRFWLVTFGWNFYKEIVPVYKRYLNTVSAFAVTDDHRGLEFFPDPTAQSKIREKLGESGFQFNKITLALAPGASFATKRWPIEYFAAVAHSLKKSLDVQIMLLGDSRDAELTRQISNNAGGSTYDFAGKFTLMESACALNYADVVLTNDSGLMHLATALKKTTVAIFGPTVKELGFFPVGANAYVIEHDGLSCRPCTHMGRKTCPKKHFKCMKEIKPKQVTDRLLLLLKQQSRG